MRVFLSFENPYHRNNVLVQRKSVSKMTEERESTRGGAENCEALGNTEPAVKNALKVKFFNCNGLSGSKLKLLDQEFRTHQVSLLFLVEVGSKISWLQDKDSWLTNEANCRKPFGLAVKISDKISNLVSNVFRISDRLFGIELQLEITVTLISVYAPHEGKHAEYPKFLNDVRQFLARHRNKIIVFLGDFNAKLGRNVPPTTNRFGLHSQDSPNGRLLREFCVEFGFVSVNSHFATGKKKSLSHTSFCRNEFKSELDLALIHQKHLHLVRKCKMIWSTTSLIYGRKHDHASLLVTFKISSRTRKKTNNDPKRKPLLQTLRQNKTLLNTMNEELTEQVLIETPHIGLQQLLSTTAHKVLQDHTNISVQGPPPPPASLKRHWSPSTETLSLMRKRRKYWRQWSPAKRARISKQIKHGCRADFRTHIEQMIQHLDAAFNMENLGAAYKILSLLAPKAKAFKLLSEDRNGNKIFTSEDRLRTWASHFRSWHQLSDTARCSLRLSSLSQSYPISKTANIDSANLQPTWTSSTP